MSKLSVYYFKHLVGGNRGMNLCNKCKENHLQRYPTCTGIRIVCPKCGPVLNGSEGVRFTMEKSKQ